VARLPTVRSPSSTESISRHPSRSVQVAQCPKDERTPAHPAGMQVLCSHSGTGTTKAEPGSAVSYPALAFPNTVSSSFVRRYAGGDHDPGLVRTSRASWHACAAPSSSRTHQELSDRAHVRPPFVSGVPAGHPEMTRQAAGCSALGGWMLRRGLLPASRACMRASTVHTALCV